MIDIIFVLVILVLSCLLGLLQYTGIKEREKLLKLLMARSLTEVTDNELIEKTPSQKEPPLPPDTVELNPDEDTIFDRAIKQQLDHGQSISDATE